MQTIYTVDFPDAVCMRKQLALPWLAVCTDRHHIPFCTAGHMHKCEACH